jgi:hypothetical protein
LLYRIHRIKYCIMIMHTIFALFYIVMLQYCLVSVYVLRVSFIFFTSVKILSSSLSIVLTFFSWNAVVWTLLDLFFYGEDYYGLVCSTKRYIYFPHFLRKWGFFFTFFLINHQDFARWFIFSWWLQVATG